MKLNEDPQSQIETPALPTELVPGLLPPIYLAPGRPWLGSVREGFRFLTKSREYDPYQPCGGVIPSSLPPAIPQGRGVV